MLHRYHHYRLSILSSFLFPLAQNRKIVLFQSEWYLIWIINIGKTLLWPSARWTHGCMSSGDSHMKPSVFNQKLSIYWFVEQQISVPNSHLRVSPQFLHPCLSILVYPMLQDNLHIPELIWSGIAYSKHLSPRVKASFHIVWNILCPIEPHSHTVEYIEGFLSRRRTLPTSDCSRTFHLFQICNSSELSINQLAYWLIGNTSDFWAVVSLAFDWISKFEWRVKSSFGTPCFQKPHTVCSSASCSLNGLTLLKRI